MGLIKREGFLLLLLMSLACFVVFATATRDLAMKAKQHQDLSIRISRLQGKNSDDNNEEEAVNCWDSLLELKSCSNEISHLGHECCHVIYVFTRNCWPALLTSFGVTVEETNILRGYCDAAAPSDHDSAPASTPVPPAKCVI
ncbi:hypothetical protein HN51_032182 [Arachis hypogaea]|uniref:Prolamin-like domain-containing protein n=1 Tax=Arachis hypogaea TaxID=3818 RepID=A0A445B5G1_ARAHY|nr:hypothetical protein Ahy_A10g048580 [Arachis hypogaea]